MFRNRGCNLWESYKSHASFRDRQAATSFERWSDF
jgi:hypothetical protein